jgi:hypothetical protein
MREIWLGLAPVGLCAEVFMVLQQRYTARVVLGEQVILVISGDDVNKLMAALLEHLDREHTNAKGEIVETLSGKVVHQCCKQASE